MSAAVSDDFETTLVVTEVRAARHAERIIKRSFDMLEFPKPDQHNVVRHGWNRPIERRPKAMKVADFELREDLNRARVVLHRRVFQLMATAPISHVKLSVLYAIADVLTPEHVRDWEPLWHAIEHRQWHLVMQELLACNWNGLVGTTERNKAMFSQLITVLVSESVPEGWV
jgi:hypothetical protein